MRRFRRSLVCFSLLFFASSKTEPSAEEGAEASLVAAVGGFIVGFTDARISEVVWISEHPVESLTDDDAMEFNRMVSGGESDVYREFRVLYKGLDFLDVEPRPKIGILDPLDSEVTLYVFQEAAHFLSFLPNVTSAELAANVWLVADGGDDANALEEALGTKLVLDSLFFLHKGTDIEEWYRIGPKEPVAKLEYGKFASNGQFRLESQPYIWDRRADLKGYVFDTAYVDRDPFVYRDPSSETGFKGVMYDMARTLTLSMNFSMNLIRSDVYGDPLDNGSWLGVVGMLQRREVDLTINDFSITEDRSKVVDFALGIFEQSAQLFMLLPKQAASWTTFVNVFDKKFWLMLLAVIFVSAVLFHFVFKLSTFQDKYRKVPKSVASVLLTFGALSVPEVALKVSTRSLFFSVCMFGAVVYWSYNAILVSLLTVDLIVLPINSLEALSADGDYHVLLTEGDAYEQFIAQATPESNEAAYKIFQDDVKNNPAALVKSGSEGGEKIMEDSKLVFFGESEGTKLVMKGYPCQIGVAAPDYGKNYVTFAFQKASPYVSLFSAKILLLRQTGEIEKIVRSYMSGKDRVSCSDSSYTTIGYENIFTAFVALLAGICAAWSILAAEKVKMIYQLKEASRRNAYRRHTGAISTRGSD